MKTDIGNDAIGIDAAHLTITSKNPSAAPLAITTAASGLTLSCSAPIVTRIRLHLLGQVFDLRAGPDEPPPFVLTDNQSWHMLKPGGQPLSLSYSSPPPRGQKWGQQ
jgi:hypothetical protein